MWQNHGRKVKSSATLQKEERNSTGCRHHHGITLVKRLLRQTRKKIEIFKRTFVGRCFLVGVVFSASSHLGSRYQRALRNTPAFKDNLLDQTRSPRSAYIYAAAGIGKSGSRSVSPRKPEWYKFEKVRKVGGSSYDYMVEVWQKS